MTFPFVRGIHRVGSPHKERVSSDVITMFIADVKGLFYYMD